MASSSIASQLQAIKSQLRSAPDPLPTKRPFTRPSLLFDPKEAADIDLRAILPIALSGLERLIALDPRFHLYKTTLFSPSSLEVDREKMVPKEEQRLNTSISSYLRLLAAHLLLPAAVNTLEYLVRRYKVHAYNADELVLSALPYHDTPLFARIVQLIDFRNGSVWSFLEGVKTSGAPPPREIIVQQCLRDRGLLDAVCNYAMSTREFCHGRTIICFFTAVIVEALGSVPKLDDETVKRILPFVFNGINPAMKAGHDEKAGALMVVGLITTRATLAPKLVTNLLFCISRLTQGTNELVDLPWLRVILMAIISLVQSQFIHTLPEKSLKVLGQNRDLPGVLADLSQDFNIRKFLSVFLETLACYCCSNEQCCSVLTSLLDAISANDIVQNVVAKLLRSFVKLSQSQADSSFHEAGIRARRVLEVVIKKYKHELSSVMHKFLENPKHYSMEKEAMYSALWLMFHGTSNKPTEAAVGQASLLHSVSSAGPKELSDPLMLVNAQEVILQRLHDDDLNVVRATLTQNGLSSMVDSFILLEAFKDILTRCLDVLKKSVSDLASKACEIGLLCLNAAALNIPVCDSNYRKEVSKLLFPLLLIHPKTCKINLRALKLAKEIQWPFYNKSFESHEIPSMESKEVVGREKNTDFNLKTSQALANTFGSSPDEYIDWLTECRRCSQQSRGLLLHIMLQLFLNYGGDMQFLTRLYELCFPIVKNDWSCEEPKHCVFLPEEFDVENLEATSRICMEELLGSSFASGNSLVCILICWAFLKAVASRLQSDTPLLPETQGIPQHFILDDLFIFLTSSSQRSVSRELAFFLVTRCTSSPIQFLSRFYAGGFPPVVQEEALYCFSRICTGLSKTDLTNITKLVALLTSFPYLLVPLSVGTKSSRVAAMGCIDELFKLWHQFDISRIKNGNNSPLIDCVSSPIFGKFLGLLISQKKFIVSGGNYLPSFITSMLGSTSENCTVPLNSNERFNQRSKHSILVFILKSVVHMSSNAKVEIFSLLKGIGNSIFKISEVRILFSDLLLRRSQKLKGEPYQSFSSAEIHILCILLETYLGPNFPIIDADLVKNLFMSLKVGNSFLDDPVVNQPCITALQNVSCDFYGTLKDNEQEELFCCLVLLFRNENAKIRGAAKEALLRLKVRYVTILKLLDATVTKGREVDSFKRTKKENFCETCSFLSSDLGGEQLLSVLNSMLEILLLKKDMENRHLLVETLFNLLQELFSLECIPSNSGHDEQKAGAPVDLSLTNDTISSALQTTLIILGEICASSISNLSEKIEVCRQFNISLLIECARSTSNFMTRNYILSLLSAFANVSPDIIFEHMLDLFSIIGEAAAKQYDKHSQQVLEALISTLVPCWLSKTESTKGLLEVFLKALPHIEEHRRLKLTVYLLRTLGEKSSLGNFLALVFRAFVVKIGYFGSDTEIKNASFSVSKYKEWEYLFAEEICREFPCSIWLPCLVTLFEAIGNDIEFNGGCFEILLALEFILEKVQDTELYFELESGRNSHHQCTLRQLMKKVVLRLQLFPGQDKKPFANSGLRKLLEEAEHKLLKTIANIIVPSEFFRGIMELLEHVDTHVKRKALQLLHDALKNGNLSPHNHRINRKHKEMTEHPLHNMNDTTRGIFNEMCIRIINIIDSPPNDTKASLKLAAISCIELFTNVSPPNDRILTESLSVVVKHIASNDLSISSTSFNCTASLISNLGSKALVELPNIMQKLLQRSRDHFSGKEKPKNIMGKDALLISNRTISHSILVTLEAIIEHLGCFLNPYLENIMKLLVTCPDYISNSDLRIRAKAALVRKLLVEKIQVRLTLSPLLKLYSEAVKCGEVSLSLIFEMLIAAINTMDRSSIGNFHEKIFEQCLIALDLRRLHPDSVKNINLAEQTIIHAYVALTMKLTESMFRPLFIRTLEWAENGSGPNKYVTSIDRIISFYGLVNKLIEDQRSLFVHYFKYLLDGIKNYLSDDTSASQKRKKRKTDETGIKSAEEGQLSLKKWHLRALIISSLHKCFLYDSGNLKFLDSSNFQVLLKPIISQLVTEPPLSLEKTLELPMVEQVDESLVCCLGQMAIAAGSDDIWKQLNHEVLMQTRHEKIRPRILGLRVVKFLLEHLKEEYLVLLPETIPFLGELLEDVEHSVKALAQEIFKELETLSGENLKQYL